MKKINSKEAVKSLIDRDSFSTNVEFLEGMQSDFGITVSNYTNSIKVNGETQKYLKSFKSKRVFIGYQKVKKDVGEFRKPRVNEESLQYFNHDIKNSFYVKKAIQIDMKAAYATVLLNHGYITKDTYEYILSLGKGERLACVGMLASVKYDFKYRLGKMEEFKIIENKFKNFFLFCVKYVQDIMNCCKMESVNCYMLTWVDAIYITYNERVSNEIKNILVHNGFNCTQKVINDFRCEVFPSKIKISLTEEGSDKQKEFYIPHSNNQMANHIYDYLVKHTKNDSDNTR